jgi:hypothetical protein
MYPSSLGGPRGRHTAVARDPAAVHVRADWLARDPRDRWRWTRALLREANAPGGSQALRNRLRRERARQEHPTAELLWTTRLPLSHSLKERRAS